MKTNVLIHICLITINKEIVLLKLENITLWTFGQYSLLFLEL